MLSPMAEGTHSFDDIAAANIDAFAGSVEEVADEVDTSVDISIAASDGATEEVEVEAANYDPDDAALNAPAEETQAESASTPKTEAEVDERDRLIAELRERDRLNQERLDKLIAGVAAPKQEASPPQEPEPLGPAPDPVADPEAYAQWTEKRVEQMFAERDQRENQRLYLEQANRVQEQLWTEFSTAHSEWVEVPDLVRSAAQTAAVELGESYNKQQLFDKTHEVMLRMRSKLGVKVDDKSRAKRPVGLDVAPKKKSAPVQRVEEEEPGSMVDQMRNLQSEFGLTSY